MSTAGTLFVIGTPIGNLEDITLRALRVLREADVVLCEDTRVTKKLFAHYDIHVPLLSFHAHSGLAKVEKILAMLSEGKSIGLVTDAGTPGISDPGSLLVTAVRKDNPHTKIVSVPGPSALTAALSVAGISGSDFVFLGFLPHKKGRVTIFSQIAGAERTVVCYESTHRLMKTLTSLIEVLAVSRRVVVVRELTKIFEEVYAGNASGALAFFSENPEKQRGEFVLIIEP